MNFILKIVGDKKSGDHRKQDGYSGIRYLFRWNDQVRAYTYDPKNQAEVDDLFKNKSMLVQYSPVEKPVAPIKLEPVHLTPEAIQELGKPAVIVSIPAKPPLDPQLTEQCIARGVIVTEDDTDEIARRLAAAYDKGATDQLSRVASASAKPRRNQPATAAKTE